MKDVGRTVEVVQFKVNGLGELVVVDQSQSASFILDFLHEVELVLGRLVTSVAGVGLPGVYDLGLLVLLVVLRSSESQVRALVLVDERKLLETLVGSYRDLRLPRLWDLVVLLLLLSEPGVGQDKWLLHLSWMLILISSACLE